MGTTSGQGTIVQHEEGIGLSGAKFDQGVAETAKRNGVSPAYDSEAAAAEQVNHFQQRLHEAVQNAVPKGGQVRSAQKWKDAEPSPAKMKAADVIGATDWAWGSSLHSFLSSRL